MTTIHRLRRRSAAVLTATALTAALGACATGSSGGAASCAAVLVHDGHRYSPPRPAQRWPPVTERTMPAIIPACNDTNGPPEEDEHTQVSELVGVPTDVAVAWQDAVYVREGRELPRWTERWFRPVRCVTGGRFSLRGDWLGVMGPHEPRFDGDIRLPYRLDMRVTDGPRFYAGGLIRIRATRATHPALTPADVTVSLWKGGQVSAEVRCDGRRFVALSLHR